jgi:hypothetical protein
MYQELYARRGTVPTLDYGDNCLASHFNPNLGMSIDLLGHAFAPSHLDYNKSNSMNIIIFQRPSGVAGLYQHKNLDKTTTSLLNCN